MLFLFHLGAQPIPPGLRDFLSFRAATIGDGILLPVLAFSLVSAAGGFRLSWAAAAAAALVAAAAGWTQYSWLRDPDPALNWTLPAPHTFTAAGWYHAVFFVGFSALSAYFAVLAGQRGLSARAPEVWLFLFAGAGFLVLWLADG